MRRRTWSILALAIAAAAGPAVAVDKSACGLLWLHDAGGAPAAARKLVPACNVKSVDLAAAGDRDWRDLRRRVQDARQQGAQRVLLAGTGPAANAALAYVAAVGDVDGVLVLGPDAEGSGSLPALAAQLKQHSPVLWVVGSDDPQARQGEPFAFAKAPPHPHSRYVTVKADRKGTAEAAVKAALEWIRSLD